MNQLEWDIKAFELLHDLREEDPILEDLQQHLLQKLGPRPNTRKSKHLVTIHILERLNTHRNWHRLQCSKETASQFIALNFAEVRLRPSGWYEMKLTAKGRQFLRDNKPKE